MNIWRTGELRAFCPLNAAGCEEKRGEKRTRRKSFATSTPIQRAKSPPLAFCFFVICGDLTTLNIASLPSSPQVKKPAARLRLFIICNDFNDAKATPETTKTHSYFNVISCFVKPPRKIF